MSIDDVMDILAIPLLGAVADDESIVISTNQGEPLAGTSSHAGQAYLNICKRLLGEEIPIGGSNISHSIFSRLTSFLKRA